MPVESYRSSSDEGRADALPGHLVALGRARARARLAVGEAEVLGLTSGKEKNHNGWSQYYKGVRG